MQRISLFCVQNATYADRLRALGVASEKILVTGTMKYDTIVTEGDDALGRDMTDRLGIGPRAIVLIGGSTHPPEERIILEAYRRLVDRFPDLFLILVPRRPERFDQVEEEIRAAGFRPVRKSRLVGTGRRAEREVLLVDTIGELNKIYAAADIVFVGGSLVPHGGQNMMEPAGLGKAVLFGPSVENFQDSVDLLLEKEAAVMVRDPEDLERVLREMLGDLDRVRRMGSRARRIIRANQGASLENLEILEDRFGEVIEIDRTTGGSERSRSCRVL
jgi:3-deoxy-D-manno-octulosonic-acid transferase